VKTLREKRGWTQEDLATNGGTTARTIQRVEANNGVSIDTMRLIANALHVEFESLMAEDAKDPESNTPTATELEIRRHRESLEQTQKDVAELCEYWKDLAPWAPLDERDEVKLEKWLKEFSGPEILVAMDECKLQYLGQYSADFAFNKVPAVCYVKRSSQPEQELYLMRGRVRKRLEGFDGQAALELLRAAYKAGATIEKLKEFEKIPQTWEEFKSGLELLAYAPTVDVAMLRKQMRQPPPELLRALQCGELTTIGQSIAIVAATKQLGASPAQIAAEILRQGEVNDEVVITIDIDREVYYFGRTRDGGGRTYGIHQPWTLRDLTDAIKNGFAFLDRY